MASSHSGYIRQHNSKFIILGRLLDALVIGVSLWAMLDMYGLDWDGKQTWWLFIAIISFQVFAEFNELYTESRGLRLVLESKRIFTAWLGVILILFTVDYFILLIDPVYKMAFTLWCVVVPIEIISWHVIVLLIIFQVRKKGRNSRRVAVIGVNKMGLDLEQTFIKEDWMGLHFVGFFDDRVDSRIQQVANKKLTGNIDQLVKQAKSGEVDIVYISLPLKAENRIKAILADLSDTTASVYFVPDLFVFDLLRANISDLNGIPIISVHDTPFYGVDGMIKRTFDVVVSLIILTIIAIPMLIIAIAVKATSPGRVIFRQRRYGFGGEKIVVWKFRSMSVSEDGGTVEQTKKNDPRVTKLGSFLRRTSLDELPQFINVLQGRMSIVGPRPHAVAHNEQYRKQIKGYMLRHKVKPGITGLAQINGFRGETDTLDKMEGRVKYDLEYISRWSLLLDIKVIFLTIFKGFVGSKAY